MKRLMGFYPYIAPIILTPLTYYLWKHTYNGNIKLILIAWSIPILWAYIVPGIGTNVFKVWEFNTKLKLGRFRPHHGFVFGSFTSFLAWLCHLQPADSFVSILRSSLIIASVLGFWNILYDIKAIELGIIKVHNQPYADNKDAVSIAMDYAPWLFGGFGAAYGFAIGSAEYFMFIQDISWSLFSLFFISALLFSIALPILGFMAYSKRVHGHTGTRPISRL